MRIEHFLGQEDCNSISEVSCILKKQTERGVNEFWISCDDDYPVLTILTNQNYAYAHFFEEEGEPGMHAVSDGMLELEEDGMSIFYTNTDTEEVMVENAFVINIEKAIEVACEFFATEALPVCVQWEEL